MMMQRWFDWVGRTDAWEGRRSCMYTWTNYQSEEIITRSNAVVMLLVRGQRLLCDA